MALPSKVVLFCLFLAGSDAHRHLPRWQREACKHLGHLAHALPWLDFCDGLDRSNKDGRWQENAKGNRDGHWQEKAKAKAKEEECKLRIEREQSRRVRAEEEKSHAIKDLRAEKAEKRRVTSSLRLDLESCNVALKTEKAAQRRSAFADLQRKVSECESQLSQQSSTCKSSWQQTEYEQKIADLQQELLETRTEATDARNGKVLLERELEAKKQAIEKLKRSWQQETITDLQAQINFWEMQAAEQSSSWWMVIPWVLLVLVTALAYSNFATSKAQLKAKEIRVSQLQQEFESELGGMMKVDQQPSNHMLGNDFAFHVSDAREDKVTKRTIKIQCPGVNHSDIHISIIFNGCIVTIKRRSEQGVDAKEWTQKFQFRPSEGMFEFKEDQADLQRGFLFLVFRAYTFQERSFRFPSHFESQADVDSSLAYFKYAAELEPPLSIEEAPDAHTAPGCLEQTAAADENDAVACVRKAETAASPIETDDFEAARAEVAEAAAQLDSCCDTAPKDPVGSKMEADMKPGMQGVPAMEKVGAQGYEEQAEELAAPAAMLDTSSIGTSDGFEQVELTQECPVEENVSS